MHIYVLQGKIQSQKNVSFLDRVTNEELLRSAGEKRQLSEDIRKGQAKFFGLVMRKENPEHLLTAGKFQVSRKEKSTEAM